MTQSYTIGEALRKARLQLINGGEENNQDNIIWAYYMLYGDPTTCYFKQDQTPKGNGEEKYLQGEKEGDVDELLSVGSYSNNGSSTRAETPSDYTKARTKDNILNSGDNICQRKSKLVHLSKKLGQLAAIGLIAGLIFFLFFIKFRDLSTIGDKGDYYNQHTDMEQPKTGDKGTHQRYTDLEWEEKKWEIVERIMDKMRQRYSMNNRDEKGPLIDSNTSKAPSPPPSPSIANDKYTLCIIPSDPIKKDKDTELLVEGLITFFEKQSKYIVIERERLDFVIRELELKTMNLSEKKLHFSLGEIFNARGILFVKVFEHPSRFPRLTSKKEAFLRLVDTKTTANKGQG